MLRGKISSVCVCVCAVDKSEKQRLQASSGGVPLTSSKNKNSKNSDDVFVLLRQRVHKMIQAAAKHDQESSLLLTPSC